MRRPLLAAVLLAPVVAVALSGCGGGGSAAPRVTAGGATFVDPIMQKWSAEYRKAQNVEIDYVSKGSGYGIANVTNKTIDFGCSDAPMNAKEVAGAATAGGEVVHVPVTIGAVAVVYNLPGVSDLVLTGEVLADIYLKPGIKWNDPAIAKLNPGAALPDQEVTKVYRAESSGTTAIFTEYLAKRSPAFAAAPGASKSPKWPGGGLGKEGNDGVAGHVKSTPGTIGYVEVAFARRDKIAYAKLVNRAGRPVGPEPAAVTAAAEEAMKAPKDKEPYTLHDLAYSFTDAAGEGSYPVVGASYAILFKKQPKDKGPVIVGFLKWVVADGQKFAPDLDYAPLPPDLARRAAELLGTVTTE